MQSLSLLGEYEVSLDAKGRFRLPGGLIAQLGHPGGLDLVVNCGFEQCLTLYPRSVWDAIQERINLNYFDRKSRAFARFFRRGAQEVSPDSADRILLPKRLLDYAGADKKLILICLKDRIEIWAKAEYDRVPDEEEFDFSALAQDVLGNGLGDSGPPAAP